MFVTVPKASLNHTNTYEESELKSFYTELFEEDGDEKETPEEEGDDGKCLITNMPLEKDHVELVCGHTFNYDPLINDLKQHKIKFNSMEYKKLGTEDIRCPYCRKIQNLLLPCLPTKQRVLKVNWNGSIEEIAFEQCQFAEICNHKNGFLFVDADGVRNGHYCHEHFYVIKKDALRQKLVEEELRKQKKKPHDCLFSSHECAYIFKKGKFRLQTCGKKVKLNSFYTLCTQHMHHQVPQYLINNEENHQNEVIVLPSEPGKL